MNLAVPGASIIQIDLTKHHDGVLRGFVLAYVGNDKGAWSDDSADYVTWRCYLAPGDAEVTCESGNYFHLSPGYSETDKEVAQSRATADFNDRRGVQYPPF